MMWTKISIDTSCEAVDLLSAFLDEKGVEGIMIEDNVPLTDEDKEAMFVDIPLIIGEDDGTAKVSCFVRTEQTGDIADAEQASFNVEGLKADIAAELIRLKEFIPVGTMNIETSVTEDTDWMNSWKRFFTPFRLYDNIVIKPTWEAYDDKRQDDIVVEIDPGIAFGTGSHETTKLCIGQIKKYLQAGDTVFDVGSGSGILSIISSLLGAGFVHGMDIDEVAVKAAKENAVVNGIGEDKLVFTCGNLLGENVIGRDDSYSLTGAYNKKGNDAGSIKNNPYLIKPNNILKEKDTYDLPDETGTRHEENSDYAFEAAGINHKEDCGCAFEAIGSNHEIDASCAFEETDIEYVKYDIVVANILADVIIPLSAVIRPYIKDGGYFITSGIINEKEAAVKEALAANGFEIIDVVHMNDWVSVVARG
ncbi:MAG: 50S ribosomal protein L11 methyltransferase [Clostridium sp.]|nr:50S ribosomal protein L11 methyltransferase [Clostridium sp.]MCM1459310.1 50S ribosomal protein L11 methyltransferase [Bacteroides sp.]